MQFYNTGPQVKEQHVKCCLMRGQKAKGFSSQGFRIPQAIEIKGQNAKLEFTTIKKQEQKLLLMLSCSPEHKKSLQKEQKEKVSLSKISSTKNRTVSSPSAQHTIHVSERFCQQKPERYQVIPKTTVSSIKKIREKFQAQRKQKIPNEFQQHQQKFNQRFNDKYMEKSKTTNASPYVPSTHRTNNLTLVQAQPHKYFHSSDQFNKSSFSQKQQDAKKSSHRTICPYTSNHIDQALAYQSPLPRFGSPGLLNQQCRYFKAQPQSESNMLCNKQQSLGKRQDWQVQKKENNSNDLQTSNKISLKEYKSSNRDKNNNIQHSAKLPSPSHLTNIRSPKNQISSTKKSAPFPQSQESRCLSYCIETPKNSTYSTVNNLKNRVPTTQSVYDSAYKGTIRSKQQDIKSEAKINRVEESIIIFDYFNPPQEKKELLEANLKRRKFEH